MRLGTQVSNAAVSGLAAMMAPNAPTTF